VVSVGAVHAAFVPGPYAHWAASCEALARQGRLPIEDAQQVMFLLQFRRLIGNTDMHSGNASVRVHGTSLAQIIQGNFTLAPAYDMLPRRWKPNPRLALEDYAPFAPDASLASEAVRAAAADLWASLAALEAVGPVLRALAAEITVAVLLVQAV